MRAKNKIALVMAAVVVLAAGAAWHYRAAMSAFVAAKTAPPPSAEHPSATPDVLYSWVDKEGVTHYEQHSEKGLRVEYDGSRITALTPLTAEQHALLEAAKAKEKAAKTKGGAAPEAEQVQQKGSAWIHAVRKELQEDAAKMQAVKDERSGI